MKNLSQCPRCDQALNLKDSECANCEYKDIENVDILDITEQRQYKQYLQFQRAAWIEFENALREQLLNFDKHWSRLGNWREIWLHVKEQAKSVGIDEDAANRRAETISGEEKVGRSDHPIPEKPEPVTNTTTHLEAVRDWVASLPDGEVDVVEWGRFLKTLPGPIDRAFLDDFRDAEVVRQFAHFETANVDSSGKLTTGEHKRVKRSVEKFTDGSELVMLLIPGGAFQMGSETYDWERPVHTVSVPSFYLGQFPVTQAQWRAVARLPKVDIEIEEHFSAFEGDNLPVDSVSWAEATEFCARLAKETGRPYRLPSEAEWEYACRAESRENFTFGASISPVIVNYDGTQPFGDAAVGVFRRGTVPVGSLGAANNFGLYDMHGNVCEWCADEWHPSYDGAPQNGAAWISNGDIAQRIVRGGSWTNTAEICRSSDRSRESSDLNTKLHYIGFRVATSS